MNFRIYYSVLFIIGLISSGCVTKKYKLEHLDFNSDISFNYINNKERIYTLKFDEPLNINGSLILKKGDGSSRDVLLVHEKGKERIAFSHLHSSKYISIFNIKESSKGNIYVNGDFGRELTIDGFNKIEVDSMSGHRNFFLAKYDKNKNLKWLKFIQGNYQTTAFFHKLHIDKSENIYFSAAKRDKQYFKYNYQELDTSDVNSNILFQIDSVGVLQWVKEFPNDKTESNTPNRLSAKALVNNDKLAVANWYFKKDSIVPKHLISSTSVYACITNFSKEGKELKETAVNKGNMIMEIFPLANDDLILLESRSRSKDRPLGLQMANAKALKLDFGEIEHQLIKLSKNGESQLTNAISYEYKGYRSKSSKVDYEFPSEVRNKYFYLLCEHINRHEHGDVLFDVLRLNLTNGESTSKLFLIKNAYVNNSFFRNGKLIIVGYSLHSFITINGEKIEINNAAFTKFQQNSMELINTRTQFLLTIKI